MITLSAPAGQTAVVRNGITYPVVSGTVKLWANDGGTLKSLTLT